MVAFTAGDAFLNAAGVVHGGFLAAMLDDTMGPALVAGLEPGDFARRPTCTRSSCGLPVQAVWSGGGGSWTRPARHFPRWRTR